MAALFIWGALVGAPSSPHCVAARSATSAGRPCKGRQRQRCGSAMPMDQPPFMLCSRTHARGARLAAAAISAPYSAVVAVSSGAPAPWAASEGADKHVLEFPRPAHRALATFLASTLIHCALSNSVRRAGDECGRAWCTRPAGVALLVPQRRARSHPLRPGRERCAAVAAPVACLCTLLSRVLLRNTSQERCRDDLRL